MEWKRQLKMLSVELILQGIKGVLIKDEATQTLAIARASICAECPAVQKGRYIFAWIDEELTEIKGNACGECGCELSLKVRSKDSECPLNKWENNG